jgi:RimJ/RimL family protein N-acetyltransferase
MQRYYKCLPQPEFTDGEYALVALRDSDKYDIMKWRNEQIDILRQKEPLTRERQEAYFRTTVSDLFKEERPLQLLFSFLHNDVLIGYGGLVHIDWESRNGEISFINITERSRNPDIFINDWTRYLKILKTVAYDHLKFNKIYTYAYDMRPNLYKALLASDFVEEARLRNHISINGQLKDVLIHSHFIDTLTMRPADPNDAMLYFTWANEEQVRKNSFNQAPIEWTNHKKWFEEKVKASGSLLLVAQLQGKPIGQIRFDERETAVFEIDFSIDASFRGKGYGSDILKAGVAQLLQKRSGVKGVVGKVKKENVASGKAFEQAGFKQKPSDQKEINLFVFENLSV